MTTTATPTRKLAFRLERGDVIRNGGRQYRVLRTDLVVLYPRAARITGESSRPAYRVTIVPARRSGGLSSTVLFEQDDLVPLVQS